jgi:prepilin-type processing-associated H-X9-DG protein
VLAQLQESQFQRRNGGALYLRPYKLAHIFHCANIALIFDASVTPDIGWDAYADAYNLDSCSDGLGYVSQTCMTDQYSVYPKNNAGQPINLIPLRPSSIGSGLGTVADVNTDTTNNSGNIRFRHSGDTQANVLMADGHVQIFYYNKTTHSTDLLRGNINVNP